MIQENTLFRSLVDAVNRKAIAAKLPSARLHLSASKLESMLVKQCLTQCLVATRDVLSPSIEENRRAEYKKCFLHVFHNLMDRTFSRPFCSNARFCQHPRQ